MAAFTFTLGLLFLLLPLLLLCPVVSARNSPGCMAGFTRAGHQCFKLTPYSSHWTAKKACEAIGGSLVEILGWRTQKRVELFLKRHRITQQTVWLGGRLVHINGNVRMGLQWPSTVYAPITNFGDPDEVFVHNSCVVINPSNNFHWESRPCSSGSRGLCAVSDLTEIPGGVFLSWNATAENHDKN